MFSVTPKNKRPRHSPEPVADRESPVHGGYFTEYGTFKQSWIAPIDDNPYESIVEDAALTWFGELGYAIGHGPLLTGEAFSTSYDVFGLPLPISTPSSPNLDLSYLNLGKKKDADGCLIAGQLHVIEAMWHFGPDSYLKANRRGRCQCHLNLLFSISCLFKRKPE